MKLINIGFGSMIAASRLLAIVAPDSAPIKRVIQEARERGMLIDASYGRKTKAVILMDTDHVILSAIPTETIYARWMDRPEEELKEPEHLKKRMLIKRTPTLEILRKQFVGRAIHTSWEHWKKDIETCCRNTVNTFPGNKQVTEKHCATCGAELSADAKFCGQCGTRAI